MKWLLIVDDVDLMVGSPLPAPPSMHTKFTWTQLPLTRRTTLEILSKRPEAKHSSNFIPKVATFDM